MDRVSKKAYAKVNLTLMVLNKRKDNYHNLKSIFQKITMFDTITVIKNNTDDIKILSNIEELNNENNIIYKAFIKLKEKYNISGVDVLLEKYIPMQAGLAGGSTDCATFIRCIDELFNLNMTIEDMIIIGKQLGADVVPCLFDGALLVEGIGDKVTKLHSFKYYLVIVKPDFCNNTGVMYNKLDSIDLKQLDNTDNVIKALQEKDINLLSNNLFNVFECVVESKQLNKIKNDLITSGAINSLMTGSGSCIYGIFKNEKEANEAYLKLKSNYKVYICSSGGYCNE